MRSRYSKGNVVCVCVFFIITAGKQESRGAGENNSASRLKFKLMNDKDELKTNKNTEQSQDLPAEVTESFGTGVKDLPEYNIEPGNAEQLAEYTIATARHTAADEDALWGGVVSIEDDEVGDNPILTGGDIDAAWKEADTVGDEAVGGTAPTPDQDIVDEIGAAVGLEMRDREFLHTQDILEDRDDRRWELDPTSSEDYQERRE